MAQDNEQTIITEWRLHHTVTGGHFVDRKQFGDFLRSGQGRSMIARAAKAVRITPQGEDERRPSS